MIHLSKSRYISGLQCEKRLWLEVHRPELRVWSEAQRALLETGNEIGRRAREQFRGGVLVEAEPFRHGEACARTAVLMAEAAPAIFEAAFEHAGVRVRVDVLERLADGSFALIEVKSGTRVKEVHLDDVALQRFVLEGCGVRVSRCELMHVRPSYTRGTHGIWWPAFFQRSNVTEAVQKRMASVSDRLPRMHGAVQKEEAPAIAPGRQCSRPFRCPFLEHCTSSLSERSVFYLPRAKSPLLVELAQRGVGKIDEIPEAVRLNASQQQARAVCRGDQEPVGPGAREAVAALPRPLRFLDFEAMAPAIPLYPRTHPFQTIPFQW